MFQLYSKSRSYITGTEQNNVLKTWINEGKDEG